jgi:signal peptidase
MSQKGRRVVERASRSLTVLVYALFAAVFGLRSLVGATSLALESSLPLVGGHGLAIVTSGSMEPAIRRGDMVITRDVTDRDGTPSSLQDIKVDDVISYTGDGNTSLSVTHRVVGRTVTPAEVRFVTKGDAVVDAVPSAVPGSSVDGRVIAVVPHLGMVLVALGSRLLVAGTVVLLLTVLFARGWPTPKRRPRIGNSSLNGEESQ